MSQKYKATGIILKGSSIKESDRLVTVLTPEYGLIRAVAPGAKKHKSRLRGRTELFVINELLIIKGRSLDKIIQADTIYTYPGLSRDIGKLAAAQYLAELCLCLAIDEQPQPELYQLLNEHLRRIEEFDSQESIYPYLAQAVFHLVAIAGLTPQVFNCCLTQKLLPPNLTSSQWRVGFSFEGGGIVDLETAQPVQLKNTGNQSDNSLLTEDHQYHPIPTINHRINGMELAILQQLNYHSLPGTEWFTKKKTANFDLDLAWIRIEKILREYIQYHLGKTIRSANLVDSLYIEF
ncbi:DNA repair protein RecO [Pleurocapsa sp. PCC 7319]|uniref:DNA repair protein RecO n=1 Tax=Pleurocapsa sp. PCC 7319 TaxID=118161 RepID=UPI0003485D40|nr:DNA repair protein RecO [Pleurocapsa sp. PCC 7319]